MRFTKNAIEASFLKLLEEKPLDKITVKDIVEDCGVNRGTFYYYYSDIYALVEDIFEGEVQRVVQNHSPYTSWQEAFLTATQIAKKEKRQLYHAVNSINREKLDRYLSRISEHLMDDFVEQQAQGLDVAQEDQEFISRFYVCALVGLVSRWVDGGMKEDPERYINKMGLLFDGNIRQALERASGRKSDKTE